MTIREMLELAMILAPALAVAAAASLACSVTGVFVALRRESLIALALPQAVVLGSAVALMLHVAPLPVAAATVVLALIALAWLRSRGAATRGAEVFVPMLYVAGMSLSILVVSSSSIHLTEVRNLFVGNDVLVSDAQAYFAVPVMLVAGAVVAVLYRRWLLLAQAPEMARLAGLRPAMWHTLFLALLATQIVVGTATIGMVLIIAMLFLPAATALPLAKRLPMAMLIAVVAGVVSLVAGFVLALYFNWPLSQSVAGVGVVLALPSIVIGAIKR